MATGSRSVRAEAAGEFTRRLPQRDQQRLALVCRQLAGNPFGKGACVTKDQAGRTLQNLLIEDWVVTYWADPAGKKRGRTEIAPV